jgi:DNA-directed RNA polymerase specialized sigma24 family protein
LQPLDPLTAQDEAAPSSEEKPVRRLPEVPSSPASQVDGIFRNQRLQAINNLPPDERKAVILCGVFGYKEESDDPTIVTAATLCGVTGRTIRNRLRRAAARLSHFKEEV